MWWNCRCTRFDCSKIMSLFFCHIHRVQDDFNTDRLILQMATSLFLKNNLKENAVSVIIQSMILEKQHLSWGFDYIVARFQDCGRDIWSFPHVINMLSSHRLYSCSKHPNRLCVDLLWCKFAFHYEVGQQRHRYNTKTISVTNTCKWIYLNWPLCQCRVVLVNHVDGIRGKSPKAYSPPVRSLQISIY